jgi:hypothetical protein
MASVDNPIGVFALPHRGARTAMYSLCFAFGGIAIAVFMNSTPRKVAVFFACWLAVTTFFLIRAGPLEEASPTDLIHVLLRPPRM